MYNVYDHALCAPHRSEWSEEGCVVNETLSSAETTVCDCYHLTHFAVMLSPKDSVGAYMLHNACSRCTFICAKVAENPHLAVLEP